MITFLLRMNIKIYIHNISIMNICFYNTHHIGDIYFSYLFINLICKLNRDKNFFYYFINGDHFFEKIPNIKRIYPQYDNYNINLTNGSPPELLIDNRFLKFLYDNNMRGIGAKVLKIDNVDILFVNTWGRSLYLNHEDTVLNEAIKSYKNLIERIHIDYNINLEFKINNPKELIDDILEINEIGYNNKNDFKDNIFIFNFIPRSYKYTYGDKDKLNNFIFELSKDNKCILACYESIFDKNENIKFIDRDYNIHPDFRCKNLIDIWGIATECKKIFILPTGASWTFLHKLNKLKENQIHMINCNKYYNILNENIKLLLGENKQLINDFNF